MSGSERKHHFIGIAEIIFALILAVILTVGRFIFRYTSVFALPGYLKENVLIFLALFIPFLLIFALLGKGIRYFSGKDDSYSKKQLTALSIASALPVIASWITAVALFYPGLTVTSLQNLITFNGVSGESYPVIHTLIRGLFIYLDGIGLPAPFGAVLYFSVHLLILCTACVYTVRREMEEGVRIPVVIMTMAYFGVFSVLMVMFRIESAEILFFSSVTMVLLLLTRADERKKGGAVCFWMFFSLTSLFRYNYLPVGIMLFIILLFMAGKKEMRKYLIASVAGLLTVFTVLLAFFPAYGIRDLKESDPMSVPVSQIATVYEEHRQELSVAEKFITEEYMQPGAYSFRDSSFLMESFNEALYLSDRSAFWDLYMHFAQKYPWDFLDSFLNLNSIIWQVGEMGIPLCMVIAGLYIAFRSKRRGYGTGAFMLMFLWITYLFAPKPVFSQMFPFLLAAPAVLIPVFACGTVFADGKRDDESTEKSESNKAKENPAEKSESSGDKPDSGDSSEDGKIV